MLAYRKFFSDVGWTFTTNSVAVAVGAITTLIVVRELPVEAWATTAIIISVAPVLALALSMGTVTHRIREFASLPLGEHISAFATFLGQRLIWACVLLASAAILGLFAPVAFPLVAVLAAARFLRSGSTVSLSARRRFGWIASALAAEKAIVLGVVIVTASATEVTMWTLPAAQVAGAALGTVVALIGTVAAGVPVRAQFRGIASSPLGMWRGSAAFGVTSLSTSVQQLDVSLVAAVAGSLEGGYFAAAARLPSTMNIIGSALGMVLLPAVASGARRSVTRPVLLALGTLFLLPLFALSAIALHSDSWVPVLLGTSYVEAAPAMTLYIFAVACNIIITPGIAILQGARRDRTAATIVACQVLSTLPLQAIGGIAYGAAGAAGGFLAASAVTTLVVVGRSLRVVRSRIAIVRSTT